MAKRMTASQLAARLALSATLLSGAIVRADDTTDAYGAGVSAGQSATPGNMGTIAGMVDGAPAMGAGWANSFTEGLADGFGQNANSSIASTANNAAAAATNSPSGPAPAQAAVDAVLGEFGATPPDDSPPGDCDNGSCGCSSCSSGCGCGCR